MLLVCDVMCSLEDSGVVTDCSIKTMEPDDTLDFNFSSTNVVNKVIIKVVNYDVTLYVFYCETLCLLCISISIFSYDESSLHLNLSDIPVAYPITAITRMVMGNSKNLCVFKFAILIKA